jgi:hypothetical protein
MTHSAVPPTATFVQRLDHGISVVDTGFVRDRLCRIPNPESRYCRWPFHESRAYECGRNAERCADVRGGVHRTGESFACRRNERLTSLTLESRSHLDRSAQRFARSGHDLR